MNTQYVYQAAPSCNAGTSISAFTLTPVDLSTVWLWTAQFRIPSGHQGTTGIALVDSGHFVIPFDEIGAKWLVGDNDLLTYDYGKELGENVQFATYNTGSFDHAWQVRLVYTPMSDYAEDSATIEVTPSALT